jgi:D-glycero-beta-D-manno-heptose-7-phosphate kinase
MINIDDILRGFTKLNVLIVGDVMIDRYLHGKVNRISPEAPVPVVELQKTEDRLGGAANVALNIKALGATPYLCSIIGADTEGGIFLELMHEKELPVMGIMRSEERITTIKTRIMAGTQQMLRVDSEMTHDTEGVLQKDFVAQLEVVLNQNEIHVIIFQDYNKGVLSLKTIHEVTHLALNMGIPTVVDPKKNNFLEYKNVVLFKPNLKEIREAVPFEVKPNLASLKKATDYLRQYLGQTYTMITLSDKGLYLESNDGFTESQPRLLGGTGDIYPTKLRNITDVSGAGDTVVSVAALCIASSLDTDTMAIMSNIAGGQVCEIAGVVPIDLELFVKEIKEIKE